MSVYIVVPAYNEADRIISVIEELRQHNYNNIIVVDDCSVDETYIRANETGVVVVRHALNRGQGAALQTGNELAVSLGAEYIVHVDGDGQMNAADITALLKPLITGKYAVALGSRFLSSNEELPALKRYIILPIGRIVNALFTGLWLSDAHCGYRAMTAKAASRVTIQQDRMAHNSEILEKIASLQLLYLEVPVSIRYHEFGQGILGGIKIVIDLFKAKILR